MLKRKLNEKELRDHTQTLIERVEMESGCSQIAADILRACILRRGGIEVGELISLDRSGRTAGFDLLRDMVDHGCRLQRVVTNEHRKLLFEPDSWEYPAE